MLAIIAAILFGVATILLAVVVAAGGQHQLEAIALILFGGGATCLAIHHARPI